jgi:Ca-activated chloride channel family protein
MRKAWLPLLGALLLGAGACTHAETTTTTVAAAAPLHPLAAAALPGPHVDGALASTTLPALRDTVVTARLTLDARADSHVPRPALNVALCLDTSGSMEGKAIEDARAAALSFLAGIKPGDGFSLVTFDSTVHVVVPPTRMTDKTDVEAIRSSIRAIRAQGTTDMEDGLRAAIANVGTLLDGTRVNRVVLVSDGVPNDPSQLRALAKQARASGISISAMGLGIDYDEILMGDLAETGGGRFRYIDDSTKIKSYLDEELTRISRVSARGATLDVRPGPGVSVEGAIGLQMSPIGRGGVQVYLGDISLGSRRDVFLRLRVHGRRDGAAVELADVTLRYAGSDGAVHEEHFFFGAHASASDDAVAKSRNAEVDRGAREAQKAADAIDAIRRAQQTDRAQHVRPTGGAGGVGTVRVPPRPTTMPQPAAPPEVTKRAHADAMRTLLGG